VTVLYLYDDAHARQFEPFALTRPVGELRVGARLIRERWQRATRAPAAGFISAPHLVDFEEADAPPPASNELPAGAIVVLGNEAAGLSAAERRACDLAVTIPAPGFGSLNVAAAAAILAWELTRRGRPDAGAG